MRGPRSAQVTADDTQDHSDLAVIQYLPVKCKQGLIIN